MKKFLQVAKFSLVFSVAVAVSSVGVTQDVAGQNREASSVMAAPDVEDIQPSVSDRPAPAAPAQNASAGSVSGCANCAQAVPQFQPAFAVGSVGCGCQSGCGLAVRPASLYGSICGCGGDQIGLVTYQGDVAPSEVPVVSPEAASVITSQGEVSNFSDTSFGNASESVLTESPMVGEVPVYNGTQMTTGPIYNSAPSATGYATIDTTYSAPTVYSNGNVGGRMNWAPRSVAPVRTIFGGRIFRRNYESYSRSSSSLTRTPPSQMKTFCDFR